MSLGVAIHLYIANCSMENKCFFNSDGDWLIVPQEGGLRLETELGLLPLQPGHIAVVPRGIKFRVKLLDEKARGYICEVHILLYLQFQLLHVCGTGIFWTF